MARFRRCSHLFLALHGSRTVGLAPAAGAELELTEDDVELLRRLPDDSWTDLEETPRIGELVRAGVVVAEGDEAADGRLRRLRWLPVAALFHRATSWRDVGVELDDAAAEAERGERDPLPPDFPAATGPEARVELPLVERAGGLYDVLTRRASVRVFVRDRPLALRDLAVVLRYVWGVHGSYALSRGGRGLRKTSPSGGSLHPVEVYPLLLDAEAFAPGLYHYRADLHALELVSELAEDEARSLAVEFTAGQTYFADAQALFVMTARFYRSFWRYPSHDKAYAAQLMDAAHLSQSFYLVCTELGLGPFVTAAINNENVDERLGLPVLDEGSLAICGCGVPAPDPPHDLQPVFEPFVPRREAG